MDRRNVGVNGGHGESKEAGKCHNSERDDILEIPIFAPGTLLLLQ